MIRNLIQKNRSSRRFYQKVDIKLETLKEFVDLDRLSTSVINAQWLKYILSCLPQRNLLIFSYLAWAGYIRGWSGPSEGERPSAYIIILGDTQIGRSFGCGHGIAAQSIMLGATEKGLGGCIIASIEKEGLRRALEIPPRGVHHVPKRPLDDIIIG